MKTSYLVLFSLLGFLLFKNETINAQCPDYPITGNINIPPNNIVTFNQKIIISGYGNLTISLSGLNPGGSVNFNCDVIIQDQGQLNINTSENVFFKGSVTITGNGSLNTNSTNRITFVENTTKTNIFTLDHGEINLTSSDDINLNIPIFITNQGKLNHIASMVHINNILDMTDGSTIQVINLTRPKQGNKYFSVLELNNQVSLNNSTIAFGNDPTNEKGSEISITLGPLNIANGSDIILHFLASFVVEHGKTTISSNSSLHSDGGKFMFMDDLELESTTILINNTIFQLAANFTISPGAIARFIGSSITQNDQMDKIIVSKNAKLVLDHSTLERYIIIANTPTSCIGGILVKGNSGNSLQHLNLSTGLVDDQGYLFMTNQSLIRDCKTAVTVEGGGLIRVNNGSKFHNNNISIHFLEYLNRNKSYVSNSEFTVDGGIYCDYNCQILCGFDCFIKMQNVHTISLYGNIFSNNMIIYQCNDHNIRSYLYEGYGIYSENSSFLIQPYSTQATPITYHLGDCISIPTGINNTFRNLKYGIYISGSDNNHFDNTNLIDNIKILNCEFENNLYGIYTTEDENSIIYKNVFEFTLDPNPYGGWNEIIPIHNENSSGCKVYQNDVYFRANIYPTSKTCIGIKSQVNDLSNVLLSQIYKNRIYNYLPSIIETYGNLIEINSTQPAKIKLLCNEYTNLHDAIRIFVNPTNGTVIQEGISGQSSGNKFYNIYDQYLAFDIVGSHPDIYYYYNSSIEDPINIAPPSRFGPWHILYGINNFCSDVSTCAIYGTVNTDVNIDPSKFHPVKMDIIVNVTFEGDDDDVFIGVLDEWIGEDPYIIAKQTIDIDTNSQLLINKSIYTFDVFPNPLEDIVNLKYEILGKFNSAYFVIYDGMGKELYKKSLQTNNGLLKIPANMIASGSGIWNIIFVVDGSIIKQTKIVKGN